MGTSAKLSSQPTTQRLDIKNLQSSFTLKFDFTGFSPTGMAKKESG